MHAHASVLLFTGGGNVLNVQRTIKQFIAAGAKGCTLEDQKWPKKSGSVRGKEVIGMDEHIAKVCMWQQAEAFLLFAMHSAKSYADEILAQANIHLMYASSHGTRYNSVQA